MTEIKKASIFPGLFLIFLGAILLLNKLVPDAINWRHVYPIILAGLGLWMLVAAFTNRKPDKGGVFPGTLLLFFGLFFLLRNFDLVPYYYVRDIWPVFLIIFGLAFLASFIAKPSDWGVLIPASIFILLGVFFLLKIYYIIDWEFWELAGDYWPVLLILIGASIIWGSLKRRNSN